MSSESSVKLIEDWRDRWEVKANWDVVAVAETPIGIRVWASYKDYPISTYPQGDILIPKPRPKTYRPWKREEVPVGSVVRSVDIGSLYQILGVSANGMVKLHYGWSDSGSMLKNYVQHTTSPDGTWIPTEQCPKCGVEE